MVLVIGFMFLLAGFFGYALFVCFRDIVVYCSLTGSYTVAVYFCFVGFLFWVCDVVWWLYNSVVYSLIFICLCFYICLNCYLFV